MTRHAPLLFALLTSTLVVAAQLAGNQQPDKLVVLPTEVSSMMGRWSCKGTFRGGKPHESIYTAAPVLNGTWIDLTEHDSIPATGYDARYLIGYDSEHKRLVEFDANTFGAATYSSQSGWKDRVLTMTSEPSTNPAAHYALNRFRYTVPSAGVFAIDWEISKEATNPTWITADHLTCSRSD